jgi:hypothetical protein
VTQIQTIAMLMTRLLQNELTKLKLTEGIMKIAAVITSMVVAHGSFARMDAPKRLQHHRLLVNPIEPATIMGR